MPFIDLTYIENQHKKEEVLKISQIIHSSLMEHFNVPQDDFFQLLHPVKSEQVLKDPTYLISGTRSDKFIVVKITCGKGRTNQQKKNLYSSITLNVHAACGIPKEDIFIILYETDLSAWSFGSGIAQMIKEDN